MIVRFGNLSISQFEDRVGITLTDIDRAWLEEKRIDNASFTEKDRFHIFDMPFGIHAGEDIIHELIDRLKAYGTDNFKTSFAVYD